MAKHLIKCLPFLAAVSLVTPVIADNDPTRPLGYKAPKESGSSALLLNSILISDKRKIAVINNRLVKEGESISGAKVITIKADQVQLLTNGKRRTLKLNTTTVKRATERAPQ